MEFTARDCPNFLSLAQKVSIEALNSWLLAVSNKAALRGFLADRP
ncbi:MAG TPA: hypothetical protein VK203_05275 [Nostocaceae cyanobacterium]|nr:hypothetical protein [Nostocaceae cyanobacterium]